MLAELLLELVDAVEGSDYLYFKLILLGEVIQECLYDNFRLLKPFVSLQLEANEEGVAHLRAKALANRAFLSHGTAEHDFDHHCAPDSAQLALVLDALLLKTDCEMPKNRTLQGMRYLGLAQLFELFLF